MKEFALSKDQAEQIASALATMNVYDVPYFKTVIAGFGRQQRGTVMIFEWNKNVWPQVNIFESVTDEFHAQNGYPTNWSVPNWMERVEYYEDQNAFTEAYGLA
jgi:hypothetical protein